MRKARKAQIPGSVRDAVLGGIDILGASFSASDEFSGPNRIVRIGDFEPEDTPFKYPFRSDIRYGKWRIDRTMGTEMRPLPTNARSAVQEGLDLMGGFSEFEDRFVSPNKVVRNGKHFPDGTNLVVRYVQTIEFGQPRQVPA